MRGLLVAPRDLQRLVKVPLRRQKRILRLELGVQDARRLQAVVVEDVRPEGGVPLPRLLGNRIYATHGSAEYGAGRVCPRSGIGHRGELEVLGDLQVRDGLDDGVHVPYRGELVNDDADVRHMRALKLSALVERDPVDAGLDGERRRVVSVLRGEDRVSGVRDPDGKHVSPLLRPRLKRPEALEDGLPDSLLKHRDRRRPDERHRVVRVHHVVRKEARSAVVRIVRDREMTDREESVRRLTEIVCLCKRDAAGLPRICLPVLDTLHGTNRLEPRCVPVVNP